MKYQYFYQTKNNEERSGWIKARNRQDAFTQLRRQGIKPYKLKGDDPIAWKRWAAIVGLAIALVAVSSAFLRTERRARVTEGEPMTVVRSQVYGDPAYLKSLEVDGYARAFPDPWDRFLARHAIPGRVCDDPKGNVPHVIPNSRPLVVGRDAPEELKKLSRIVNGMKQEADAYLRAGGAVADYMKLCCERCRTEAGILDQANRCFSQLRRKIADESQSSAENIDRISVEWERQNRVLRSFGLPTTPFGEE